MTSRYIVKKILFLFALLLFFCFSTKALKNVQANPNVHLASSEPGKIFAVNTVLDGDDYQPGDGICSTSSGFCTLRAAIDEANALSTNSSIILPEGTFQFTATDENSPVHLQIIKTITIQGISPEKTIIDGDFVAPDGHHLPIFEANGDLTLRQMTLKNGWYEVVNNGYLDPYELYGAVTVRGTLTVDTVLITDNITGIFAEPVRLNGVPLSTPHVTVLNSSIVNNGSGVQVIQGSLNVTNSTISGNYSGGIDIGGSATISNSTITKNTRPEAGTAGGIYHDGSYKGSVIISHTIVAGNEGRGQASDCEGSITSDGYNLIEDTSLCAFSSLPSDITNVDPLLGPLQQNGGLTPTHALLEGSPAIDSGDPNGCGVSRDQRGYYRPFDGDQNGDLSPNQ